MVDGRVQKVLQKALGERGHGMRVIATSPEDAHHAPKQA
jgi:hypothetical protein